MRARRHSPGQDTLAAMSGEGYRGMSGAWQAGYSGYSLLFPLRAAALGPWPRTLSLSSGVEKAAPDLEGGFDVNSCSGRN